jgi:hypothetical protein
MVRRLVGPASLFRKPIFGRVFWTARCPGLRLLAPFGLLLASFGSLLASFGSLLAPFGSLFAPFNSLWAPSGRPFPPFRLPRPLCPPLLTLIGLPLRSFPGFGSILRDFLLCSSLLARFYAHEPAKPLRITVCTLAFAQHIYLLGPERVYCRRQLRSAPGRRLPGVLGYRSRSLTQLCTAPYLGLHST